MRAHATFTLVLVGLTACTESGPPDDDPVQGVVFTYPVDGQLDVPRGARIVVSFAEPLDELAAGAVQLVGPDGPVEAPVALQAGGATVTLAPGALAPGTSYEVVVDASVGPVVRFTTRDDRPRPGPPRLIALNGSPPTQPGALRPIVETSTLQLVFSEPLDPRWASAVELVDEATGATVACRRFAQGIHVALDPIEPLVAGASYELRLGDGLRDLDGTAFAAMTLPITPIDSLGRGTTPQTLRLRADGDPVAAIARLDARNEIALAHPLIGTTRGTMAPGAVMSYLGDPAVQGGPIAFTIPRGQRLSSAPLDVRLGGVVPSGLSTGDIRIEILADATGQLRRNRHRPDGPPDNATSPIHVDLSLDLGVFATDPLGNAVLAQTVLGVQFAGVAMADDGALALELHGAMEIDLLGVASAPVSFVIDLVTDPSAAAAGDTEPPALSGPEALALSAVDGVDLLFTEPIDVDRAAAGGITLRDAAGEPVAIAIELAGAAVTVRPRAPLAPGAAYDLELGDVADVAGNPLPSQALALVTPAAIAPTTPVSVAAASPGTACARVDGRCAGGLPTDDVYHPFALAAGDPVEVAFDQDVDPRSLVLGVACGDGSVRVEHIDAAGTCLGAVAGALVRGRRSLSFVPEAPWTDGDHYRVLLVSGPDAACGAGEICGANGKAASFDGLAGASSGGPDLMIDFVGAPAARATRLFTELDPTLNRAALRIVGTSGIITSASFQGDDCVPETPEHEACMAMLGSMPAELGEPRTDCALPDGTIAEQCVPVRISAQQMAATSITMTAGAIGIPINAATGTSLMRVREPAAGVLEGYMIERDGAPTMIVALDLYMDAPDMALPIGEHDMHSKPLSVLLSGPVRFRPDGRIAIELGNTAEVPIEIAINALGLPGGVSLVVPAGGMRLELRSRPRRRTP